MKEPLLSIGLLCTSIGVLLLITGHPFIALPVIIVAMVLKIASFFVENQHGTESDR